MTNKEQPKKRVKKTAEPINESSSKYGIEDLSMPKAIIQRIVKSVLDEDSSVKNDAKNAISKAATVFISQLADKANSLAKKAGVKTVNLAHVLVALKELELSEFVALVERDMAVYKEYLVYKQANKDKKVVEDELMEIMNDEEVQEQLE